MYHKKSTRWGPGRSPAVKPCIFTVKVVMTIHSVLLIKKWIFFPYFDSWILVVYFKRQYRFSQKYIYLFNISLRMYVVCSDLHIFKNRKVLFLLIRATSTHTLARKHTQTEKKKISNMCLGTKQREITSKRSDFKKTKYKNSIAS